MEKKEKEFLSIIKNISTNLIKYNNIDGYNDIKKYNIVINHIENNTNTYELEIYKGTNNPKLVINYKLETSNNLNENLEELIIDLINNNECFQCVSFTKEPNLKKEFASFCLNFDNDVIITFKINSKNDEKRFKVISNLFDNQEVIKKPKTINYNKDQIQKEKAKSKLELLKELINIDKIDNNNNYNNYKFYILNSYSEEKKCYIYELKITNSENKTLFSRNFSIKNKKNIYKYISKILNMFNKDNIVYTGFINSVDKLFKIVSNSNVDIICNCIDETDLVLFNNYKNTIDKNNIKKLTK